MPSKAQAIKPRPKDVWARARNTALCAALLAGLGLFAFVANKHYPVQKWLVFDYTRYWLFCAFFALASMACGLRIVNVLIPLHPRLGEQWTLAFALGVLVFTLGTFVGGWAGLFGHVFFFTWPTIMLAFGARRLWRATRRAHHQLRRFGASFLVPRGWAESAAAILLIVSLVAVYLQVITPLNVGGDAYWYHLPIAEHYVASGSIRPFAEGWYLGAYPHLASLLYTWAFQSPGDLFDHVALSSHLEWTLFLATLAGISAFTRKLLGGVRSPYAAAAVFLFPGIFLYDSSLITGADHVLAFWAPALGLALVRMGGRFVWREAVLAGTLLGAAILTKYQASYFFVPVALLVTVLSIRTRRIVPAIAWAGSCLVASSAHWLKNWIAYGDPFYPLLHKYLAVHPFHAGAADRMYWDAQFLLTGTFWQKVSKTLVVLANFSFVPHNWSSFHGDRPVFGSLFTLLIPALLLAKLQRHVRLRIWLTVVGIHAGIVVWFITSHQDRYLQALLPWMASCTAAALITMWRMGRMVRLAAGALVAFQIYWGSDVYFIRSHSMVGDSPLKATVDYLAAAQQGRFDDRRRLHGGSLERVGARVPRHSKVLVHERHDRLGLGAPSVSDTLSWQGAVDYMVLDTPKAAADLWRALGVTHVMWWHDYGEAWPEEMAREAVFARTLDLWSVDGEVIGDKRLHSLLPEPRDGKRATTATKIMWLGCDNDPPLGLFTPRGLVARTPESIRGKEEVSASPSRALADANVVIARRTCDYVQQALPIVAQEFVLMRKAGDVTLWVRH